MSGPEPQGLDSIQVDTANLYREETITDLRVATVRRLVPIQPDGTDDPSREAQFMGQTSVLTEAGMIPIQCRLEGKTLDEALAAFPEAIKKAVNDMVQEVREMQRQAASRIVVPKGMPPTMKGGPGGGGGMIRMP
jgi:hypothetical protein